MLLCFPVLGLGVFSASPPVREAKTLLYLGAKGVQAQGMETAEGFVVRASSGAVKNEVPSCHAYLKELRAALISKGVLQVSGDG